MTHNEVLKLFESSFPFYKSNIETWFPNGRNCIRVRQTNKQEIIFMFNNSKDWKLETVDSFIKSLKEKK